MEDGRRRRHGLRHLSAASRSTESPASLSDTSRATTARAAVTHLSSRIASEQSSELFVSLHLVLGLTMAHEVAHLLLPDESHSADGLMRSAWNASDYWKARLGQLRFTDEEAQLMRDRLSAEPVTAATAQSVTAQSSSQSVHLRNDARVDDDTLEAARQLASEIHAKAGLDLIWANDEAGVHHYPPASRVETACQPRARRDGLYVRWRDGARATGVRDCQSRA